MYACWDFLYTVDFHGYTQLDSMVLSYHFKKENQHKRQITQEIWNLRRSVRPHQYTCKTIMYSHRQTQHQTHFMCWRTCGIRIDRFKTVIMTTALNDRIQSDPSHIVYSNMHFVWLEHAACTYQRPSDRWWLIFQRRQNVQFFRWVEIQWITYWNDYKTTQPFYRSETMNQTFRWRLQWSMDGVVTTSLWITFNIYHFPL